MEFLKVNKKDDDLFNDQLLLLEIRIQKSNIEGLAYLTKLIRYYRAKNKFHYCKRIFQRVKKLNLLPEWRGFPYFVEMIYYFHLDDVKKVENIYNKYSYLSVQNKNTSGCSLISPDYIKFSFESKNGVFELLKLCEEEVIKRLNRFRKYPALIELSFQSIATLFKIIEEDDIALNFYKSILKSFEKYNINGKATIYLNVSKIYYCQNNIKKADSTLNKALKFSLSQDNKLESVLVYFELANRNFLVGKTKIAKNFLSKALFMFTEIGHTTLDSDMLNLLGNIAFSENDFLNAEKYYKYAYEGYAEINYSKGKRDSLLNLHKLFLKKNDQVKVEYYKTKLDKLPFPEK